MRMVLGVCLALVAVPAAAQGVLYKCLGAKGAVSYQSAPCGPGQRVAAVREATPEPPPTLEQLRARQAKAERDRAESAYLSRLAGTDGSRRPAPYRGSIETHRPPDTCALAKAERERVLKAVGMGRTYDLLRSLNDAVWEACKGR